MAVQRKRFRVEEMTHGQISLPEVVDPTTVQDDYVAELRAMRDVMASPQTTGADALTAIRSAEALAMLDSYRAQIEQCEKLKVELDLIHDAIGRTKNEIAALHGKSFSGGDSADVNGELGAIVGGTEEATQRILEAAESIDNAAGAISGLNSPDQQRALCSDIQDGVVSIFEACNFQDLTGQRIRKVMSTMALIESHINVMMDIWGGVDAIKAHAPPRVEREGDARLLNGPKMDGDGGHVSQDDIDALFD